MRYLQAIVMSESALLIAIWVFSALGGILLFDLAASITT